MPRKKLEEVADGIFMEPVPITLGDEVRIKYKGLLAKAKAEKVFLHAGYGPKWEKPVDLQMRKGRDGSWSVTLNIEEPSEFNFCFHDNAQNWDNNFGRNWSYQVHTGDSVTN